MFQLVLLFARTFLLSHITTFFSVCDVNAPSRMTSDTMMFCIHFVRLNPKTSRRNRRVMNSRNKKVWFPFICQPTLPLVLFCFAVEWVEFSLVMEKKECLTVIKIDWYLWDFMLCCVVVLLSPLCSLWYHGTRLCESCCTIGVKKSPVHSFHFTVCFVFYFPLLLRLQLSGSKGTWKLSQLEIISITHKVIWSSFGNAQSFIEIDV